jgi:hypothetical protein
MFVFRLDSQSGVPPYLQVVHQVPGVGAGRLPGEDHPLYRTFGRGVLFALALTLIGFVIWKVRRRSI